MGGLRESSVHRDPPLAAKDGGVVDWEAIRRYHKETNGWSDIGYHYEVERVGNGILLQVGRPELAETHALVQPGNCEERVGGPMRLDQSAFSHHQLYDPGKYANMNDRNAFRGVLRRIRHKIRDGRKR